jgi:hypothetical protein
MTAEEYIINELEKTKKLLSITEEANKKMHEEKCRLECIVDTLKAHARFDGEYISIMVGGYDGIKDRNFLVKELGLTKEEHA